LSFISEYYSEFANNIPYLYIVLSFKFPGTDTATHQEAVASEKQSCLSAAFVLDGSFTMDQSQLEEKWV